MEEKHIDELIKYGKKTGDIKIFRKDIGDKIARWCQYGQVVWIEETYLKVVEHIKKIFR